MQNSDPAITRLLHPWHTGDESATNELVVLVYDQLRRLAAGHLKNERPGQTLAATALVHEAYLKIAGGGIDFQRSNTLLCGRFNCHAAHFGRPCPPQ